MTAAKPEFLPVEEQMERLTRGAVDCVTEPEFCRKLERSCRTRTPMTVKVGFDPTAPDIHLGHAVLLRKMRQSQDLGHRMVFVIGDFTGMIGDPTGRSKTRPALTREEIESNAETYRRQCFKVLDPERTEIRFNSEWLGKLGSEGLIRLASQYNVARMLERNDFKARFRAEKSIAIHEFLYPLAQAYDSVALEADVELGGTDQLFNLNVGRDIMPGYGQEPQVLLTTPLLEGLDGTEKMSKSLGNYVGIEEAPAEIFGKLMSISDDLMWRYYELCTDVSPDALVEMKALVDRGELHPKKAKEGLAARVVTDFHDEKAAVEARQQFDRVFKQDGLPDDVPEHRFPAGEGTVSLPALLTSIGLASSRSEVDRLLKQGGVRVDDERPAAGERDIRVRPGETRLIRVGKRRFARVTFE